VARADERASTLNGVKERGSGEDPDGALVRRLQAGDEAAVDTLIARYQRRVFGLALRLTGSHEDAEEVAQDVFWKVVEGASSFRGEAALSTWIYRISTNAALMRLRKRPKTPPLPLDEALGPAMTGEGTIAEAVPDWSRLAPAELERKELAERLEAAVQELPPDHRAVVVLRDVQGLSADEACEILGISLPALKSRLHRGRLFLRKRLSEYLVPRIAAAPERTAGGHDA
jgi:RNA polymerase sigma-70 factor, ECF subfamily